MNSELLDRMPPHNKEAECGVLGSVLIDPKTLDEVMGVISADDFYLDAMRRLYKHVLAIHGGDSALDSVTLVKSLKDSGDLERIGGMAYLAEVVHSVPHAAHAVYYAKIVAEQSRRRRVIQAATTMLGLAWDNTNPIDEIVNDSEAELQAIPTGDYHGEPIEFQKSLIAACDMIDEIMQHKRTAGVMIGLESFDSAAGGLFPGELAILAARPSIGKTALALQIAQHVAGHPRTVYFASLEMKTTELALRILCAQSGVPMARVRAGSIGPSDTSEFTLASAELSRLPILLHDRPGMKVSDIARACRRLASKGQLGLIVVDYLQRVTPADRRQDRHLQVGQITWDLKALALELQVPVLCLCQLGRAAEERDRKTGKIIEPRLSHLKESGDIEQDADMVMLLHRQQRETDAVLILAKNRQGEQARFNLLWEPERTQFVCSEPAKPVGRETDFDEFGG